MRLLLFLVIVLITGGLAEAQAKRAFIIGVQDYQELTDLTKTRADAEGYARVFADELGFEVTKLLDPNFSDFLIALSEFEASIQEGDEIVFVFSGHGWSDGASNYLAMADAPKQSNEVVLERLTFDLNSAIIATLQARDPSLVVAIIDACRDNPFDLGTKSVTKGLVPQQTIPGTLVVYAAGANQQALDRLDPEDSSPYSVFTRTLLPKLDSPETPLMRALDDARNETAALAQTISHRQRPAIYSDVSLDFCFAEVCATGFDGPPDPAIQRETFLRTYHENLTVGEDEDGYPREVFPRDAIQVLMETDLNNDGYLDFYVKIEHIFFCGSGGCLHDVVLSDNGSYRSVMSSNGGALSVLQTSKNGVQDLSREAGFTYERMPVYEILRYDGSAYRTAAMTVCWYKSTYCELSQIFGEDNEEDRAERMVFYPLSDEQAVSDRIDRERIYKGTEAAIADTIDEEPGKFFDYAVGMNASEDFVLVDVWKNTYGVARLKPAP